MDARDFGAPFAPAFPTETPRGIEVSDDPGSDYGGKSSLIATLPPVPEEALAPSEPHPDKLNPTSQIPAFQHILGPL